MPPEPPAASDQQPSAAKFPVVEWLLILLSFAVFASLRSPVPGVNEPHYLTKAKHFWDPAWCGRDPFLQSSNAHYVFYATLGVLTRFCSLEQTAWIGRVLGWMVLSSGWIAFAGRLLPFRWGAVWSAWVFLFLAALGNWSGEWVVGGIEAKVLSYGCGWWSLACALSGQPIRAAAWSGAAVSFHPVVGIWNTAAVVFALFVNDWRIWRVVRQWNWKQLAGCAAAWSVLAAPGLIPAVGMLRGADKNQSYQADYIQVFHRLAHHLDPWKFSTSGYWGYAFLLGLSVILYFVLGRTPHGNRRVRNCGAGEEEVPAEPLDPRESVRQNGSAGASPSRDAALWNLAARYVMAAVLIAVGGVAIRAIPEIARGLLDWNLIPAARDRLEAWIDYRPHLSGWLKFYPFRLADVAIPWGASLLIVRAVRSMLEWTVAGNHVLWNQFHTPSARCSPRLAWAVFGGCFAGSLALPAIDRNPSRLTAEQSVDWVDACRWIERETPRDTLCYAANDGWALKWYAQRADYLSHKDCPQDAPGIIAWNERLKLISKWSNQHVSDGFSPDDLRELRRLTGIDYLITRKFGPIHMEPVYQNRNYNVYQLPMYLH